MDKHFDTDVIKSSIDIVDVVSKDEPLQKSGDTYRSGHESAGHSSRLMASHTRSKVRK